MFTSPIISATELKNLLESDKNINISIIDASWYLPNAKRNPQKEFTEKHIPTARYFDVDAVCLNTSEDGELEGLPHMMPTRFQLAEALGQLEIDTNSRIVVYDTHSVFSSPRLWYTLVSFWKLDRVAVLDGGLPAWIAAGGHVVDSGSEKGKERRSPGKLSQEWLAVLRETPRSIRTFNDIKAFAESQPTTGIAEVVDMRSEGRFSGTQPEPRPGLSSGHMPNSVNVPFTSLISPQGQYLPVDELSKILRGSIPRISLKPADQQIDPELNVDECVFLCGSGMTACIGILAAYIVRSSTKSSMSEAEEGKGSVLDADADGLAGLSLYDGSWVEYAQRAPEKLILRS